VRSHGREGCASRERGRGNNLTPVYLAPPTTPVIDSHSLCVHSRTSNRSTDRTPHSRRTSRTPPCSTSCRTGALAAEPATRRTSPRTHRTGYTTSGSCDHMDHASSRSTGCTHCRTTSRKTSRMASLQAAPTGVRTSSEFSAFLSAAARREATHFRRQISASSASRSTAPLASARLVRNLSAFMSFFSRKLPTLFFCLVILASSLSVTAQVSALSRRRPRRPGRFGIAARKVLLGCQDAGRDAPRRLGFVKKVLFRKVLFTMTWSWEKGYDVLCPVA
jgi:hypothetical protein